MPEMTPTVSDNIRAFGYDEAENVLAITFVSGPTYCYKGVNKSVYNSFLVAHERSESIGAVFEALVRGQYVYQRMTG